MTSSPPATLSPNRNRSLGTETTMSYDNDQTDAKPLLSRGSSVNGGSFNQMQRRRVSGKLAKPERQQSLSRDIGHAAAETYLLTRLTITLLRYLGVGYRWITRLAALGIYAALLMPGFLQVAYNYFFSSQVRRSIVYGDQPRNRLDLYLPKNLDGPKPVMAFVTGGAWIIGYKAWGSLLGQQLAERDIIVACIDYRNFPQGTIGDMVTDASQGISFICNNIAEYGGDPNRIYLMGQSAGAHISACALLDQAIREAKGEESISWSVFQIKAYFGLSGGYNLCKLVDHFNNRGLYRALFLSMMEGEESLKRFSPGVRIEDPSIRNAVSLLPPVILFHGTADYSIPSFASKDFAAALQRLGAQTELILFDGKTHSDLFLQVSAELDVLFYSCYDWFTYSQPNCEFFLVNQNPTTTSVYEQIPFLFFNHTLNTNTNRFFSFLLYQKRPFLLLHTLLFIVIGYMHPSQGLLTPFNCL